MTRNNHISGILFKLLTLLLTAIMAVVDKVLARELNIFQMFFVCSALCLIMLAAILKFWQKSSVTQVVLSIDRTYLYGGICNFTALCSFLYAIRSLNINVVTSITYLKPLFVIFLAVLFLREKLTTKCIVAFISGALGSYVVAKPQAVNFQYNFELLYAFIPAVGWAAYDFVLKKQVMRDHWLKQAFGTALVATVISLPFGLYNWAPLSTRQCFIFLSLGCLAVLNKIAVANAFARLPLVMLMPLEFTRLIFVSSIAYLFLGEKLVSTTAIGFCVIAAATLVLAHKTNKKTI